MGCRYITGLLFALYCSVVLAVPAPTKGTFEGLYRCDRWGDGTFWIFEVSPGLLKELEPWDGKYVRIWVRDAIQLCNPGPPTLYKVWSVKPASEPKSHLRITSRTKPDRVLSSIPFTIEITLTNTADHPIIIDSSGAHLLIKGEARDRMEVNRCWANLWGLNYSLYPSHEGILLISTRGYVNWKDGVVISPLGGINQGVTVPPGAATNLSLPFTNGLPAGRYEVEISARAYPIGDETRPMESRTWLKFDIDSAATINRLQTPQ